MLELILTLAAVGLLAWLLKGRIHAALALLVASLPFERIGSFELPFGGGITVRPSQLIGAAIVINVLPTLVQSLKRRDLELLPLIYLAAGAVSAFGAPSLTRSLLVLGYTLFVWLLFLAVRRLAAKADLGRLETVLWWTTFATLLFGLYQFAADTAGVGTALTGLKGYYTKDVFGFPRIQSFALEPLYLANLLLIPLTLFSARFLRRPDLRLGALLLLLSTVIALTLSRGGYAASLVALAIVTACFWHGRRALALTGIAAAGVVVALMLISGVTFWHNLKRVETFTHQATNIETGASVSERTILREKALDAFKSEPLFGVGIGNFGRWAHSRDESIAETAIVNNEPLELLAETGLVGFSAIVLFILAILRRSLQALRRTKLPEAERIWIVALSATLIGWVLQYQTFSTLYITYIWVALGLLVAVQDRVLKVKEAEVS